MTKLERQLRAVAKKHDCEMQDGWFRAIKRSGQDPSFIDFYVQQDGISFVDATVLLAFKRAVGAKTVTIGRCSDANPQDGLVVTLYSPKVLR